MQDFVSHLVGILLLASVPTVAHAELLNVYILTGQSNALGTTSNEGTTAAQYGPESNASDMHTKFFWSNVSGGGYPPNVYGDSAGSIKSLQIQQGRGVDPTFWGPEFGFARALSTAGPTNLLIIKACRGGGGNTLWDKSSFDADHASGHMWGHLRDTVDAGLTAAIARGHQVRVRGLLYMQGESNASAEAAIADQRLSKLSADLQQHIDANFPHVADGMKTVIGEIAASSSNADRMTTTSLQRSLSDRSAIMVFIQTHDLPLKSDGLHFGRDAKLEIGRRFAEPFLDLRTSPRSAIDRSSIDSGSRIGSFPRCCDYPPSGCRISPSRCCARAARLGIE